MHVELLDLYCCAGGCSWGYSLAAKQLGFTISITGVDINPQPNYPFKFVQSDAIEYLKEHGHRFTHIHASPPCQKFSKLNNIHKDEHPDLIEPTRLQLIRSGKPYVIENVPQTPLIHPVKLQGSMFGLKTRRERWFETSTFMMSPIAGRRRATVKAYRKQTDKALFQITGHSVGTIEEWSEAMGIDWMTKKELTQAIPPAYTKHIGIEFLTW